MWITSGRIAVAPFLRYRCGTKHLIDSPEWGEREREISIFGVEGNSQSRRRLRWRPCMKSLHIGPAKCKTCWCIGKSHALWLHLLPEACKRHSWPCPATLRGRRVILLKPSSKTHETFDLSRQRSSPSVGTPTIPSGQLIYNSARFNVNERRWGQPFLRLLYRRSRGGCSQRFAEPMSYCHCHTSAALPSIIYGMNLWRIKLWKSSHGE